MNPWLVAVALLIGSAADKTDDLLLGLFLLLFSLLGLSPVLLPADRLLPELKGFVLPFGAAHRWTGLEFCRRRGQKPGTHRVDLVPQYWVRAGRRENQKRGDLRLTGHGKTCLESRLSPESQTSH